MHEVGDGCVVVLMWLVDGEGIAEVFGEGIDEGCGEVVCGEVGFEISRKDVGNLGGEVVADTVELNRKVARKGCGCSKGGTEAITSVDDGVVQSKEGDEGCLDVVEGR